jgi:hypothetical protein
VRDRILDTLANEGVLLEPAAAELVLRMASPLDFMHTALSLMVVQQSPVVTLGDLAPVVEVSVSLMVGGVVVSYAVDNTTTERWRRDLR